MDSPIYTKYRNIIQKLRGLPEKNKLLILSLVVGLCSGLAAVILHSLVDALHSGLTALLAHRSEFLLYFVLPGVGMLLALLLVRYVIKDNIGHGVTKVLVAVSKNESRIKPHNMWSSLVTSVLTIGFGGSVGAEAPIVYTGAAIGSNFARYWGLSYRSVTILLGCGAAGAVAGIFKAPLAGVLFCLEILLFNISMTSMMPLLLSTVSATVVSYLLLGDTRPFECTLSPFAMVNMPFYLILGFFCGACSLYFLRTTLWLEDKLGGLKAPFKKWGLCALGLGLLIFLFPPLYGEGYDFLYPLLNGGTISFDGETWLAGMLHVPWLVPVFFLLVMLLKVFSMTFTNAGGGVGGTFGPTLFVGAIAGFVMARTTNLLLAGSSFSVPEQNFVLVGMAGLMAGADDGHLPHCGNHRRLRPLPAADPHLDHLFRNHPDLREIFHLYQADRPDRRTADTRQRPGGPDVAENFLPGRGRFQYRSHRCDPGRVCPGHRRLFPKPVPRH